MKKIIYTIANIYMVDKHLIALIKSVIKHKIKFILIYD